MKTLNRIVFAHITFISFTATVCAATLGANRADQPSTPNNEWEQKWNVEFNAPKATKPELREIEGLCGWAGEISQNPDLFPYSKDRRSIMQIIFRATTPRDGDSHLSFKYCDPSYYGQCATPWTFSAYEGYPMDSESLNTETSKAEITLNFDHAEFTGHVRRLGPKLVVKVVQHSKNEQGDTRDSTVYFGYLSKEGAGSCQPRTQWSMNKPPLQNLLSKPVSWNGL